MTGMLHIHDGTRVRLVQGLWFEGKPAPAMIAQAATVVTASSSAHKKGAWTEIIAASPSDAGCLRVRASVVGSAGVNTATLVDVAVGAAGAEVAIASNVAVGGAHSTVPYAITFDLPVYVPAGSRISARIQSVVTGGKTATIAAYLMATPWPTMSPAAVDTIGGSPASSEGIPVTSAGTWVEAVASSARSYRAVGVVPSLHTSIAATALNAVLSVGVGAAGAEVEVAALWVNRGATEMCHSSPVQTDSLTGVWIPAGSRIAVRDSLGGAGAGATVIGVPL